MLKEGFDLDQAMAVLVQSNDPIALKVVVGSMPQVRPELKADLYGTCGSPGVWRKGPARVIMSEDELSLIQEGDILVAASTSPQLDAHFQHDQRRGCGSRGQSCPMRPLWGGNTVFPW